METKRKGIYKASHKAFLSHNGKVIAFKDTKQIRAFKHRYFNLYCGLRLPAECLYARGIEMSDKTIPYEDIPSSELKERDAFWLEYFKNNMKLKEGDIERYGNERHYISLD